MKRILQALFVAFFLTGSFASAQAQTTTNFTGTLTNAATFTRPRAIGDDPSTQPESFYTRQLSPSDLETGTDTYNYYLQALVPQVSGNYSITITSATLSGSPTGDPNDTFLILYANSFTPSTPLSNLVVANDDIDWTTLNFFSQLINVPLVAGTTYYVVTTSYETGATGTIDYSVTGPGAVNLSTLPVRWLGFTANRSANDVELHWTTATEQNTKDYEVQHSADGYQWSTIGIVGAAGYSSVVQRYAFADHLPLSGNNYYRLLQRDLDGHGNFSKVVLVRGTNLQQPVQLYPNPVVNGTLMVRLDHEALAELYRIDGTRVLQKRLHAGTQFLSLQHLPKGVYTFKTENSSQILVLQ